MLFKKNIAEAGAEKENRILPWLWNFQYSKPKTMINLPSELHQVTESCFSYQSQERSRTGKILSSLSYFDIHHSNSVLIHIVSGMNNNRQLGFGDFTHQFGGYQDLGRISMVAGLHIFNCPSISKNSYVSFRSRAWSLGQVYSWPILLGSIFFSFLRAFFSKFKVNF